MALTKALVQRHAGRARYEAALLDVAQDHALYLLQDANVFARPGLVFKGGTSLRKCRLGTAGRFSTDIDLAAADEADVDVVRSTLDGASVGKFEFSVTPSKGSTTIYALDVRHAELGNVTGIGRVEFSFRRLALPAECLAPAPIAIHRQYAFKLEPLPVIAEVEACAEKLARYRRTALARDLYDLAWFASRSMDERLLRRLWVLKVFLDVVDEGHGKKPFSPADVLTKREVRDFPAASIGELTQTKKPDIEGWERKVRARFAFLEKLDADEQQWVKCNVRDREEVVALLATGGFAADA